jgi:tRNA pseudouridine38-40 synthase
MPSSRRRNGAFLRPALPEMTNFKALLEYDGSRYSGWQDQKNARTVMGELRKAAAEIFQGSVEMQGAGRTDAGVHALGQVMHLKVASPVRQPPPRIMQRFNDLLPADIVILDLVAAPRNFHARHDATSRVYLYQISTRKQAFMKKYVWWVKDPLNVDSMRKAAALLPGRHDFAAFRAEDPSRPHESTVVVIEKVEIEIEDEIITVRIEASHFLWRMVRRIVGLLVKIGTGEVQKEDLAALLSGRASPHLDVAAWTAPASGLFLERIRYLND